MVLSIHRSRFRCPDVCHQFRRHHLVQVGMMNCRIRYH
jgi:hypothetical protein